jgi:hypothetical protein
MAHMTSMPVVSPEQDRTMVLNMGHSTLPRTAYCA